MADSKKYVDILTAFPYGMSSGVAPLLLDKGQAAFAINCTFRGGYATDRSPVQKLVLDFGGDAELENAVRKGFFQGSAPNGYRPDFGPTQNVAQISGRLFAFTESGDVTTVTEITVPGDPNAATTAQVWMWQSGKWLIVSDGSSKLPIFYDGVTSRRSYGPSVVLGTTLAVGNFPTPRVIGEVIQVTMSALWENPPGTAGPFNVPVRFNGAIYQPIASPSPTPEYDVILTPVHAVAGATIPAGSVIEVVPAKIGFTATSSTITNGLPVPYPNYGVFVTFESVPALAVGDQFLFSSRPETFTVQQASGAYTNPNQILAYVPFDFSILGDVIPAGTLVQKNPASEPSVVIGTTSAAFINPATGVPVTVGISKAYTGPDGQIVWISDDQYSIAAAPPPAPSTALYLVNLSDTADAGGAIPAENITSIPEIPACRMGAYGQGQNWFSSVDGLSFGMSDLVGSSSGTQAYNYRDAVLKTSDLEITGSFPLPSSGDIIASMTFTAVLDRSLGQGPLQIGIMSGMFSCRAPFTLIDFQGLGTVNPIENPILPKSLIGFGPIAQNSTILANSDTIFRQSEGVGSFIEARRQFSDVGGNTPISREMTRIIDRDIKSLLSYSSAIVFDNRLRMTCAPQVSGQGVFHLGELVLNYDLLSSLRGKAQPVWDGFWSGLNTLQYTQGFFGPVSRAFAFTFNLTDSQIELYELLPTGTEHFDNGSTRIIWVVETPVLFNASVKNLTDLARLMDGECYLSDINGRVDVTVKYRPVFHPCWIDWHTFQVCSDMSASNGKEQVVYPLGLGEPTARNCDEINNRPFREAVGFQLRFEFTGHCKLWGVKALGEPIPTPAFAKPAGNCDGTPVLCKALNCDVPDDYRIYSLDGLPPLPVPVPDEPILPFANDEVYYEVDACGAGTTLTVVPASLQPGWILMDNENNRVVGVAGTFRGLTKAAANAEAQSQLDDFVVAALADGSLVCAAIILTLFYDTFESYTNGVAVNGLGEGNWTDLPSPYVAD